MRPPALVGKKRQEAARLCASGLSDVEVAKRMGVSDKTVGKIRKEGCKAAEVLTAPARKPSAKGPAAPPTDPERLLEEDLAARIEIRDGLLADFRYSNEPRERTLVAREITSCLDGIRKVVAPLGSTDEDEDVEASGFDAYMMRIFGKAQVIVQADSGVPGEEESLGAVGPGGRASGTDG